MRILSWLGEQPRTPAERFLCEVLDAAQATGTRLWLYGGYALDALTDQPLREHHDVDFLVRREEWPRLSSALDFSRYRFNFNAPPTSLSVTSIETGGYLADILLPEEHPEGFPFTRASLGANPWPPGSLSDGPTVRMWGRPVGVVTWECLFVMKASGNFSDANAAAHSKHKTDLDLIRTHLSEDTRKALSAYFPIRPLPQSSE